MKVTFKNLAVLAVSALLCSPTLGQVTILDFGADNEAPSGVTIADINAPYTEIIEAGDGAPVALSALNANTAFQDFGPTALNGGATISWSNVTSWNNNGPTGNAGENYFAHVPTLSPNPTTYTITTANPLDVVTVEAIAGSARDALIDFGGSAAVDVNPYSIGTPWTLVGSSTGTASGTLDVSDSGDEGNIGAFRVTITPASAIPEPTSLTLLGLIGVGAVTRRRRS